MLKITEKELKKLLPKIELVDIDQIKLNPKNPRTITQNKFDKLVKSIEGFWQMLFLRPVVLDEEGMVLGGNMRTMAATKAGLKQMPCIRAEHLSHAQRAEFIVKDNVPFGDWNFDDLANNWDSKLLTDWGMEIPAWKSLDDNDPSERQPSRRGVGSTDTGTNSMTAFTILFKADTETQRQQQITRLKDAGFIQDTDFFIV